MELHEDTKNTNFLTNLAIEISFIDSKCATNKNIKNDFWWKCLNNADKITQGKNVNKFSELFSFSNLFSVRNDIFGDNLTYHLISFGGEENSPKNENLLSLQKKLQKLHMRKIITSSNGMLLCRSYCKKDKKWRMKINYWKEVARENMMWICQIDNNNMKWKFVNKMQNQIKYTTPSPTK